MIITAITQDGVKEVHVYHRFSKTKITVQFPDDLKSNLLNMY